jgi:hypothetical protein
MKATPKPVTPRPPPSLPAHPLFPAEGDEPPARVEHIHVTRWNPATARADFCLQRFAPDELTELSQIAERFGGGLYELIAYAGGGISKRRKYSLPGKSLPLDGSAVDTAEPPPAAVPAGAMSSEALMLGMFQAMQAQSQQTMALIAQQSSENTKAMATIVAAIAGGKQDGSALVEAMSRSADRQTELMMRLLGERAPASASALDLFKQGLAEGQKMAEAVAESADGDDTEEAIDAAGRMAQNLINLTHLEQAVGGAPSKPAPPGTTPSPEPAS